MPQNQDRKQNDLSRYDGMSTEELSEILRLDSETPEGNGLDIDTLLYITGVLAERKKTTNTGKTAQEAWKSFQQNYWDSEDACPAVTENSKPIKTNKPWIRRMIAAVLVVVLLVCIPLSVKALNWEDIRNAVVQWAKETFSFVTGEQPADNPDVQDNRRFESVQDAFAQRDIQIDCVPAWIPEGYTLESVDVDETPVQRNYIALYTREEQSLNICVRIYTDKDPEKVEIDENIVETYPDENGQYYIISNNGRFRAVWTQDSYECSISGDVTIEEIKLMIDSIPKG